MNKKFVFGTLAFIAGAAGGTLVTWKVLRTKYDKLIQEEVESVKEYYKGKYSDEEYFDPFDANDANDGDDTKGYDEEYSDEDYEKYKEISDLYSKSNNKTVEKKMIPYVIPPEEFDTIDDYDSICLTYFADGILADDAYRVIFDSDEKLGEDFASHFGEFEDDAVFIRNNALKCDYEIILDTRQYRTLNFDSRPTEV